MVGVDLPTRLRERLKHFGATASAAQCGQLAIYIGLLTKWNKILNLTALSLDPLSDAAIDRLVVEAFLAASVISHSGHRLLDLGSGGGSPAIPLKIAVPRLSLAMVESKARKSAFLREAIRVLELQEASVETLRIESLTERPSLHAAYDLVSVRAVRLDAGTWNVLAVLVAPGGRVLWFRSRDEPHADASHPFNLESIVSLMPGSTSELGVFRRLPS